MSCGPIIYPPCPPPECPENIEIDLSNGNLNGVGVLDSFASNVGVFRGIVGDGVYTTATLDAPNKSIVVSLTGAAIAGAIPQATEVVAGIGEVATQAETNAGASDIAFVTPLKLGARAASTTQTGLIRIATVLEAQNSANGTLAFTPLHWGLLSADLKVTQQFANVGARNAATPSFAGQLGAQIDTLKIYIAPNTTPGNWQEAFISGNTATTFTANTAFNVTGAVTFELQFGGVAYARFSTAGLEIRGSSTFTIRSASTIALESAASLDFNATALLKVGGTSIPASSVVVTGGTAGQVTNKLINTFLSTANLQTGWGTPSGTLLRTTFAAYAGQTRSAGYVQAEAQATDDAVKAVSQRLAALITDLKSVLLPAT